MPAADAFALAGGAALTGAIAVALLGPKIISVVVGRGAGVVRRLAGTHGSLAVINTRTRAAQFASVLMPITLGAAVALGNVYAQTTEAGARLDGFAAQLQADAVVTSTIGGTTPDLLAEVRATPGVATASALVSSIGWIEDPYDSSHASNPWPLFGVDPQQRNPVIASAVTAGSLADLAGDTVALPEDTAEEIGVGVGNRITMRLGDGAQAGVRVIALLDSPGNYPSLVLPAELLAPHTSAELPAQVLVRAEPGQDPSTLTATIRERVRSRPGVQVGGGDALLSSYDAGLSIQAWITYLISLIAVTYATIASINTIAVTVLARRREFGLQRLSGATRAQVTRMVLVESTLSATLGLTLGGGVALFTVVPMAVATSGSPIPAGPLWVLLAVCRHHVHAGGRGSVPHLPDGDESHGRRSYHPARRVSRPGPTHTPTNEGVERMTRFTRRTVVRAAAATAGAAAATGGLATAAGASDRAASGGVQNGPPTFILLNGTCASSLWWAGLTPEPALRGYRTVAVDLPGHGVEAHFPLSYQAPQDLEALAVEPSPLADITIDDYVDRVVRIVRRARRHGPVILVAHSQGGVTVNRVGDVVPSLIDRIVYIAAVCCVELPQRAGLHADSREQRQPASSGC